MTQLASRWASVSWPGQKWHIDCGELEKKEKDIGFEPRSFSRGIVFIPEATNTESKGLELGGSPQIKSSLR